MTEDRKYQIQQIKQGIKCTNVKNHNQGVNLMPFDIQIGVLSFDTDTHRVVAKYHKAVRAILNNNQSCIILDNGLMYDLENTKFTNDIYEKLFNICYANNKDVSFEYCPYCENEAVIPYQMKMGICNHCGAPLAPCAYCNDNCDTQDCHNCPFNNTPYRHDKDDDTIEELIYIVDLNKTTLTYQQVVELSCDDFIELAEEQGNVNTPNGFMQRWNIYNDLPNPKTSVMRVYEQVKRL